MWYRSGANLPCEFVVPNAFALSPSIFAKQYNLHTCIIVPSQPLHALGVVDNTTVTTVSCILSHTNREQKATS